MRRSKPSAADVARLAGVSRTTVSFVLNNTPGKAISEQTRKKVLDAARELNYEPDEVARSLSMTRHRAIGLLICRSHYMLSDAFTITLIEGMAKVLNRHRYRLVLQPVQDEWANYSEIARTDELDGIVIINPHADDPGLDRAKREGIPLVIIGTLKKVDLPQVDIDNVEAAKSVIRYLIELGHEKIAMISHADRRYVAARDRIRGYRDALREAGLPDRESYLRYGNFTEESGWRAAEDLLDQEERPSAIFAGNDTVAYGVYRALWAAGLRIPEDISIAGMDDDFPSRFLNPPMTSMSVPAASIGAEAARLCIDKIMERRMPDENRVLVTPYLSVRSSCASLKAP